MDESDLEASLELYRTQLLQVETAIQASGPQPDLTALQADLRELIQLTEESLLSAKKSRLLQELESRESSSTESSSRNEPTSSESLLSAKKSRLLQELESRESSSTESSSRNEPTSSGTSQLDNEYAAFQAAILEEDGDGAPESSTSNTTCQASQSGEELSLAATSTSQASSESEPAASVGDSFSELVGLRCRAPFSHDWGGLDYHNALVFSVEAPETEDSLPKVRVMFCHPTHRSMVPCPFFLDGKCRFSDSDCRYSHGHLVEVESLREYKEPDFSHLGVDKRCLARGDGGVWFHTTVVEVGEDEVQVMDGYGGTLSLQHQDVLPLEDLGGDSSSSSDSGDDSDDDASDNARPGPSREKASDSDSENEVPIMLWKPPQTLDALGEWEQHTKGVGSKLMAKMGYVVGQGLGPKGEGRALPVPIQLLPQGKSLDKIMELKEMAGDKDLFDAMRKLKRKKRKMEKAAAEQSQPRPVKSGVFDFLNKRLGGKKGSLGELTGRPGGGGGGGDRHRHNQKRHIEEAELDSRSDRHINVQLLKTEEEIKKTQREIQRLKQSFSRNESKDRKVAAQVQEKIASLERYIQQLQGSEVTLQRHRDKRIHHKKLTIF